MRMAFVWSRLALAAVLAAGAACAPAETCPEQAKTTACHECDGPRLVCSDSAAFVLFDDGLDDAIACSEASAAEVPRIALLVEAGGAHEAPAIRGDVLLVAPKTSPPRT